VDTHSRELKTAERSFDEQFSDIAHLESSLLGLSLGFSYLKANSSICPRCFSMRIDLAP
jgi:hypothetical protein